MILESQITFTNIPHSDAIEATIRKKIEKLEHFYDRIMHCDVVVEEITRHHNKGRRFNIRILLTVPGEEIVITRTCHSSEDIYVAIRDAFNAAKRKLQDYARRRRGDKKSHALPLHGIIKRIYPEEGYGFIESNNNDYYFSMANVTDINFGDIAVNTEVMFIPAVGDEGWQANRVTFGKHHRI